jgi:hypothetical protein
LVAVEYGTGYRASALMMPSRMIARQDQQGPAHRRAARQRSSGEQARRSVTRRCAGCHLPPRDALGNVPPSDSIRDGDPPRQGNVPLFRMPEDPAMAGLRDRLGAVG